MSTEDDIPQGRVRRVAPLAGATARTAGDAVVRALRRREDPDFPVRAAERYAEALGRSKGALMKAGQLLSVMALGPTVPPEFQGAWQAALGRLRSDAPPMSGEAALGVVAAELGPDAFATFDPEPLAAASIGQVHRARLHDGRAVAVKVQYPGAAAAIAADLKNHELLTTFLAVVFGMAPGRTRLPLRDVAVEVSERVTEELDYRIEARNQRDYLAALRDHPFLRVPAVVDSHRTARVLTQDLAAGRSWTDALTAEQALRDAWAESLSRFFYGPQARDGLAHADPHPGNFLFHDDGGVTGLDYGCVQRLDAGERAKTYAVLSAMLHGDADGVHAHSRTAGFFGPGVTRDEAFAYWRASNEMYWAEQPYRMTPERAAEQIAAQYAPIGPFGQTMRQSTAPGPYVILARIDIGLTSMKGELRAEGRWGSMLAETVDGAAPQTPLGRREAQWLAGRST